MVFVLIPFLVIADDYKSKLDKVKKEIELTKQEEKKLEQKERSILKEIDQINRKISKSKTKLNKLKNQENALKDSIKLLEIGGETTAMEIGEQEKLIVDRVRFMYEYRIANPVPQINPTQSRNFFYIQQMLNEAINRHNNLEQTKTEITTKEEEEKKRLALLLEIKNKEEVEQKEILAQSIKKKQLLNTVKKEKTQKAKLIKELEEARVQLETLIARRIPAGVKKEEYTAKELGSIIWPVQGEVVSKFGTSIDPKFGTQLINKGIDIRASYGTNVMAVSDGKVAHEGQFLGYGKIVLIDHQNGFCTLYCNLSETLVTTGEEIKKGEIIGRVGTGGIGEESTLHFELRRNGVALDPLKWLKQGG